MGCDIHMFLERQRATDKKWVLDSHHEVYVEYAGTVNEYETIVELKSGRTYEFFGELAGVRYKRGKVIPKGIPKDASEGFLIACAQNKDDAHSHSYISISKYAKLIDTLGIDVGFDVATSKSRNPFTRSYEEYPFSIVLAYVHDEKESNAVNLLLTGDPYYLDEKFRLVFFFDS